MGEKDRGQHAEGQHRKGRVRQPRSDKGKAGAPKGTTYSGKPVKPKGIIRKVLGL